MRPAEAATEVVQDILERELQVLSKDPDYQQAVQRIEELQRPVLKALSDSVRETLKVFLPTVQDVQVHASRDARYRALSRSC